MKANETTPDELLDSFKGRSLKSIIVFTIVVHALILIGTSIPALVSSFTGEDLSGMDEKERLAAATKKAQEALEVIDEERNRETNSVLADLAEAYDVKPQDLGDRVKLPAQKAPLAPASDSASPTPDESEPAVGEEPKSAIEKEIEKVEAGPDVPPIEDEEEDLFK